MQKDRRGYYKLAMNRTKDVKQLVAHCRRTLPLSETILSKEYFYWSLPLCVIDAVFSIGIRYSITQKVVIRYCDRLGIPRIRESGDFPPTGEQHSISDLLSMFDKLGTDEMTLRVFQSRHRTSSQNGILKSEATKQFANILKEHRIEYFHQLHEAAPWKSLEEDLRNIKGQASGISFRYFLMLAGNEDFIKPDRMIHRFLQSALDRDSISSEYALKLLQEASAVIKCDIPRMTPRLLDHTIWKYQRSN